MLNLKRQQPEKCVTSSRKGRKRDSLEAALMEQLHIMCIEVHYLHVRCQPGERLSPTSPNTQKKSIPWSLPQDPADSADVLYCIHEKHKLQLWGVDLIVLLQVILNHNLQLWAETVNCGYQIKAVVRGQVVVCKHS